MTTPETLAPIFAPTGVLRVALNHGNRVLVGRDDSGHPVGISVDLAHALAKDLGLPLRFVEYDRAVDVSASAQDNAWDVCFLAVDPKRSETIDFSQPYVRIDGCYLASSDCPAVDATDLVRSGVKVGSVTGSAYTLTLERLPGAENIVLFDDIHLMLAAFERRDVSAVAGIGTVMHREAEDRPRTRVLTPPFMEIRQAMAVPRGRPAAAEHLRRFLTHAARSGLVGDILETHGVSRNCAVIPN
ncbi:transporter substrate-binding domain-containing protein (plasmid) [Paracoccus sp. TK19116]|uniref:Transporter substrate-binding domain-containing protein n=1 Tax=Paracoccus albicereus TaxID=2922394 RepID=A0ABT1MPR0_9RHOB|nr:transporter substrate-binding domain-containing protein [Paracoccus albicereus]MCQ0969378.1 transporter substrate-binding domain-containing protein [Paracoccus albicereus]